MWSIKSLASVILRRLSWRPCHGTGFWVWPSLAYRLKEARLWSITCGTRANSRRTCSPSTSAGEASSGSGKGKYSSLQGRIIDSLVLKAVFFMHVTMLLSNYLVLYHLQFCGRQYVNPGRNRPPVFQWRHQLGPCARCHWLLGYYNRKVSVQWEGTIYTCVLQYFCGILNHIALYLTVQTVPLKWSFIDLIDWEHLHNSTAASFMRASICCSITINGNTVACSGSCQAIVDSGTSLIVGPSKDINNINGWVGAYTDQFGNEVGSWLHCSAFLSVCLTLNVTEATEMWLHWVKKWQNCGKLCVCLTGCRELQ